MADPMRIRAQLAGDKTTVRVLMAHEMETGQRKDSAGKTIPAWFIQEVTATHNGKPVLSAQFGTAVSKDPFMLFTVKGVKAGDKVLAVSYGSGAGSDGFHIEMTPQGTVLVIFNEDRPGVIARAAAALAEAGEFLVEGLLRLRGFGAARGLRGDPPRAAIPPAGGTASNRRRSCRCRWPSCLRARSCR